MELQHLIRKMAHENPSWGEERIASELLLKLGLRVSPRTIRKYMPKLPATPPGGPRGDQRWATFLKNHARVIIACDFCVVVTASFRILYVLGELTLREADRNPAAGVSGLDHSTERTAPEESPGIVDGILQPG